MKFQIQFVLNSCIRKYLKFSIICFPFLIIHVTASRDEERQIKEGEKFTKMS